MASPKNIHSDSNAHTEPHSWGAFHTRTVNKKFIILMGHKLLHLPFSLTISLCRCVRSRYNACRTKVSKTTENLHFFVSRPPRHEQPTFPSSLWMSFPGLQHTQEIGSVIVYVSVENVATVSFFRLSAGPYFTPSLAEKQNRAPHCWVSVSAHCFRTANRSQS